eukprot:EG_transcript_18272
MTKAVANFLRKRPDLQKHLQGGQQAPDIAACIAGAEGIVDLNVHANLTTCVADILNSQAAVKVLEAFRSTAYDSSLAAHEKLLLRLWTVTFPEVRLDSRMSEQWKELGFQGVDPATDFRGGGILSLLIMLFAAQHAPNIVRQILRDLPPTDISSWYPYAVATINLVCDSMRFAKTGGLDHLFYAVPIHSTDVKQLLKDPSDACLDHPAIVAFGKHHVKQLEAFHTHWMQKRPGTMEFNIFKEQFLRDRGELP